ncbi:MAG: hypothetical protein ISQ24_04420 [PS1 clade bacterium]|nr:hypothetical protein [PS1 clade bacterium]MBL6784279.1 hypothetical protein [PS1 clade bacterium]
MSVDPKQPSEIIPPTPSDGDATASATAHAGAHLRMPHFIDQARDWRSLLRAPLIASAGVARRLVNGLVYRLTLTLLLVTAIGVTGFGVWQARHMQLPQFDSFWYSINPDDTLQKTMAQKVAPSAPADTAGDTDAAGFESSGDLAALQRRLAVLQAEGSDATRSEPASEGTIEGNAPDAQIAAQLADERAAHDNTRAKLLAMQNQLAALTSARADVEAVDENLAARAALGDLLLRLDNGAAYDDVLEGGALARVLRRSEWALLALYADSGVPTRAALLARFEIWIDNRVGAPDPNATGSELTGFNPSDKGTAAMARRGFYAAVLDWLRKHAVGLVDVRVAPLATAGPDIERIATALERGRHDEAAWRIGALLRRMDGDINLTHPNRAGLQLLYDDVSAAAELAPMLAALRDDYMAGVRP